MGVHGLWELLAPVGRRVSVETLTGKKLAIDASIWMVQFMKAMRDEKGDMIRNAHILGFFRRICKLLFLRTKPVFVFDGGTPALKRRTVVARRRQRENAQAKIRKMAEKLLLNHVKVMRVKELAEKLESQKGKNNKRKKAVIEEQNIDQNKGGGSNEVAKSYNHEELDEMLAACLAAEENDNFTVDASTSGAGIIDDKVFGDEDTDDEEEMILPKMHGKVDPAVLASLPPSMQLDLLVQMRERLMAENRQKYQKVKKVPSRFSELQIQAYLKTVAFRREIDGVQKSAAGRGIYGVQTSRIASEANREFIFSSSYTGDKQTLTSIGSEKMDSDKNQNLAANLSNSVASEARPFIRSDALKGPIGDQTNEALHDEVNTYLDERGRLRVSRVRALGIRMTRDLQRNLDLMREIEEEKSVNQKKHNDATIAKLLDNAAGKTSDEFQHHEVVDSNNEKNSTEDNLTGYPSNKIGTMEISFEYTGDGDGGDEVDHLFSSLVVGHTVEDLSIDPSDSLKQSLHSDSDCEWEDGVIEHKRNIIWNECKSETAPSLQGGTSDEAEVEWEEEFQDIQENASFCPDEGKKTVSKGTLVEEAEFQEAIKRSLDDMIDPRLMNTQFIDLGSGKGEHTVGWDNMQTSVNAGRELKDDDRVSDAVQPIELSNSTTHGGTNFLEERFVPIVQVNPPKIHLTQTIVDQNVDGSESLARGTFVASQDPLEEKILCQTREQLNNSCNLAVNGYMLNRPVSTCSRKAAQESGVSMSSSISYPLTDGLSKHHLVDAHCCVFHKAVDEHVSKTEKTEKFSAFDSTSDEDCRKVTQEKISGKLSMKQDETANDPLFMNVDEEHQVEDPSSMNVNDLEEEMLFLCKEQDEIGNEQRKLERNAESVSSEMFTECQELLQMFGLPYIIAPMEAEAQCAHMESMNLVDGVVTDDCDAFLFGARSVYKNIFDDRKYVETYLMKDIENELGLKRDKLINMALLLGSDYTEGVSGIGIVNAIEVVNAFPERNGLLDFREWIESPDPAILGNYDVQAGDKRKGKRSKGHESLTSYSSANIQETSYSQNDTKKMRQIFMDKHRNVSKNWHIPSSFPSDAVISAYMSPQVDKSTESFSWGKPDLFVLRKLCWEKFGWNSSKADELLLPVLKEYDKHETQLRIEAFYSFNERFAKIRSKRIRKAVKGIAGNKFSELMAEEIPQQTSVVKKRKMKTSGKEANKSRIDFKEPEGGGTGNHVGSTEEANAKLSKRRESASNLKESTSTDKMSSSSKKSHVRKNQKGQGQGKLTGRGTRKINFVSEDTETSYEDCNVGCSKSMGELQFNKPMTVRSKKTLEYPDDFEKESEPIGGGTDILNVEQAAVCKEAVANGGEDPGIIETGQENKMGNTGTSQTNGDFIRQSKEYLHLGGGFCLGEEDDTEFGGFAATRETTSGKCDEFSIVEEKHPVAGDSNLNPLNGSITNTCDDTKISLSSSEDSEKHSVGSLRAMPNLRRKRRKI